MPWEVTGPVRERERFIEAYLTGFYTITELADRFGMSRQNLHKWLARHNLDGMKGLVDRSRAPLHIPHRTSDEVTEQIIAFRRRFPHSIPNLVRQDFWGLLLAHFAVRALMHEAALEKEIEATDLSFTHAVRTIARHLPLYVSFFPSPREEALQITLA